MADLKTFSLLQQNGNPVKRPYVVTGGGAFAGFKPDDWAARLL